MCRSSESWRLKSKGEPGRFEEGEAGAVVHLEEGMERPTFVYFESTDHPQTEEILVKSPRLLGITAAISLWCRPLIIRPSLAAAVSLLRADFEVDVYEQSPD